MADQVSFEGVREKVCHELDMYVDEPEFIDLFEFVVSMGAHKNTFMKQLLEFGSVFRGPEAEGAPPSSARSCEHIAP